jgi:hypothetical protein
LPAGKATVPATQRVIRPQLPGIFAAMIRSTSAQGFSSNSANVASPRLIDAVVASLAFGAFSLCLAVTIAALSLKASGADLTFAAVLAAHS